jgi:ParB family transcriptional regulator, chromosome partitioning protein
VVIKTRDDLRVEEALAETLGAVVKLSANRRGKGRIVIEFSNLEQLQGIVERIEHGSRAEEPENS